MKRSLKEQHDHIMRQFRFIHKEEPPMIYKIWCSGCENYKPMSEEEAKKLKIFDMAEIKMLPCGHTVMIEGSIEAAGPGNIEIQTVGVKKVNGMTFLYRTYQEFLEAGTPIHK